MTISTRSPASISDEGRHARDRGDPVTANPYPPDTDAHRIWARGYRMPDAEAQVTTREVGAPGDVG
ncbi:hypothetical protein SAMN05216360_11775 [Methylobacterium phyllostachyos]|uniref:Uncharacterized protein n=1 Tax=Methylobacterium phyllostachyos TaxID=582672 RepID=A0A1H0HZG1_9HYPH|nr:Rmf/CrpP family protein [Methylobacterium phyllostachyos]SDO24260.1 hypothetical protein SAMN05216360_11775 [Methylobacterium phyllostachyos]